MARIRSRRLSSRSTLVKVVEGSVIVVFAAVVITIVGLLLLLVRWAWSWA